MPMDRLIRKGGVQRDQMEREERFFFFKVPVIVRMIIEKEVTQNTKNPLKLKPVIKEIKKRHKFCIVGNIQSLDRMIKSYKKCTPQKAKSITDKI